MKKLILGLVLSLALLGANEVLPWGSPISGGVSLETIAATITSVLGEAFDTEAELQEQTSLSVTDSVADTETIALTAGYKFYFVDLTQTTATTGAVYLPETGMDKDDVAYLYNAGTHAATFPFSTGVQEFNGGETGDSLVIYAGGHLTWRYTGTRWVCISNEGSIAYFTSIGAGVYKTMDVNAADGTYDGTVITKTVDAGATSVFGQALHIDTDGELIVSDADVGSAAAMPTFCLAVAAGVGSKSCLTYGTITETEWNWTIGGLIYASDDPAATCGLTQTAPATAGDQVQVLGVALSADTIFFNPTNVLVEVP